MEHPDGGFKEVARRRGEILIQSWERAHSGAWGQVVHLGKGKQIRLTRELCWPRASGGWVWVGKTVSRVKPRKRGRQAGASSPRALKTGLILREDVLTQLSMLVPILIVQGPQQASIYSEYHYPSSPRPFSWAWKDFKQGYNSIRFVFYKDPSGFCGRKT